MKRLWLLPLALFGCEFASHTPRDLGDRSSEIIKINEVSVWGLDCHDTDYFGNESFAYKINPVATDGHDTKVNIIARDVFSATFCEAGLSSIYEKRDEKRAEVYRLLYHPSPSSPIVVEFNFEGSNSFLARSWENDWLREENPDGTNRAVPSRYEKWEPVYGHLSDDQAHEIRSIFDSEIVCKPVDPRSREGDATARIFEYLLDSRYCALIDFTRATGSRSKEILSVVGLSELYEGE